MKQLTLNLTYYKITGRICSPNCTETFATTLPTETPRKEFEDRLRDYLRLISASRHHLPRKEKEFPVIVKGRLITGPENTQGADHVRLGAIRISEVYEYTATKYDMAQEIEIFIGNMNDINFKPMDFNS